MKDDFEYECCACKSRVPTAKEGENRDSARTCPICKAQEGFRMIKIEREVIE